MGDVEVRIKVGGSSYAFGIRKLRNKWQLHRLCFLLEKWYLGKTEDLEAVKSAERIVKHHG